MSVLKKILFVVLLASVSAGFGYLGGKSAFSKDELVLTDKDGVRRCEISLTENGPTIVFSDKSGKQKAGIYYTNDDCLGIYQPDKNGKFGFFLQSAGPSAQISFGADERVKKDFPNVFLGLYGENPGKYEGHMNIISLDGEKQAAYGIHASGSPFAHLSAPEGEIRMFINEKGPAIKILDANEKVLWSAP